YVTLQYNGANPNKMNIYTVASNGALTLVNSWTGNSSNPVNLNPGSMVVGITGNEGEGTGNIYWKNFIIDDVSGTFPLVPSAGSPTVANPTFTPIAGTYTLGQGVTLATTTGGATICYTTDGSTPTTNGSGTCTHGTTYSTTINVSSTQTVK